MIFDLTEQDLQIIDKALQQLPFYLAAPLISKLNKQLEEGRDSENPAA